MPVVIAGHVHRMQPVVLLALMVMECYLEVAVVLLHTVVSVLLLEFLVAQYAHRVLVSIQVTALHALTLNAFNVHIEIQFVLLVK